jgi:hypothetical protein
MPDYVEVVGALDRLAAHEAKRRPAPVSPAASATALRMEELTGSPEWDAYRERLAEWRRPAESERDRLQGAICGNDLVGDDLLKAKLKLQWQEGFLVAIQQALDLPASLMAAGKVDTTGVVGADS